MQDGRWQSRRPGPSVRLRVTEWEAGATWCREDRVATEEPLELRLAWPGQRARRLTVTMRTPGHDFELAAGLTYAEGLHRGRRVVESVAYCTDRALLPEQQHNVVTVTLTRPPLRPLEPRADVSSACGVCGKQSLEQVAALGALRREPAEQRGSLDPRQLVALPDRLRDAQAVFDRTGGLHAAGLYTRDGDDVAVREDVGRHNAVDKVVGHALLAGIDVSEAVLCVSGRVGFDIVQKAATAGVPTIVAVGAPSSLAVELARSHGLTVAGFVRGHRMVVYSHPERLGETPRPRPSPAGGVANE